MTKSSLPSGWNSSWMPVHFPVPLPLHLSGHTSPAEALSASRPASSRLAMVLDPCLYGPAPSTVITSASAADGLGDAAGAEGSADGSADGSVDGSSPTTVTALGAAAGWSLSGPQPVVTKSRAAAVQATDRRRFMVAPRR